jgi:CHASE3 domain sensor protein
MQNLREFVHFIKKNHEKLIQKMQCVEKIISIFSNILQKNSSQKSFLRESENDHKKDCNP